MKKAKVDLCGDTDFTPGKFHDPHDVDGVIDEYEGSLKIDENGLDEALQMQADLVFRVGKTLALQISRRDAAKQFLAEVEAVADENIRYKAGDSKLTEKGIESKKRLRPEIVEATGQLLQMNHSVAQWSNLKEAVLARGFALNQLVTLYVNNYYATAGQVRAEQEIRSTKTRKFD